MGFSKKCENKDCKKDNWDIYTLCENHYKEWEREKGEEYEIKMNN